MTMTLPGVEKRAVYILFGVMLVIVSGYGMVMPILPFYAQSMGATPTQLGLLFASYPLMQFLFSQIWGRYSDQVGRRPMILYGLLGFGLSFTLLGLGKVLWVLFLARILGGILSSAAIPASYAYVADITNPKGRGRGMSLMSASSMLGIFIGPAFGGFLGDIKLNLPFFAAALIAIAFSVVTFFLLPESRTLSSRENIRGTKSEKMDGLNLLGIKNLFGPFGIILLLSLLIAFASGNLESTLGLMVEESLGFGAKEVGYIFTVSGLSMVITQGFITGPLIDKFGEMPFIFGGLLASIIGYFLLPFASSLLDLLLYMGIMSIFTSGMRPAIVTLLSRSASESEQGSMLGENTRFMSLGRVIGPVTGGALFAKLGYQSPFLFASSICFCSLLLSYAIYKQKEISKIQ